MSTFAPIQLGSLVTLIASGDQAYSLPVNFIRTFRVDVVSSVTGLVALGSTITIQHNRILGNYVQQVLSNLGQITGAEYQTVADSYWEDFSTLTATGSTVLTALLDDGFYRIIIKSGDYDIADGTLTVSLQEVPEFIEDTLSPDAIIAAIEDYVDLANKDHLVDKGTYNASTGLAYDLSGSLVGALANNTGTSGEMYKVTVAGTQDFGNGNIVLAAEDLLSHDGYHWEKLVDGTAATKVNKAGDAMTGNLSAPKVAIGTTDFPAIDTIGEGLVTGASLDGVTQTTRTSRSRIGNAELNFVVNHNHSTTQPIDELNLQANSDSGAHVSVVNGQLIKRTRYGGRYQSGGTGSYYLAASDEVGIDDTGTISATSMPGKRVRKITPNGSKTPVVFETVNNAGNVVFSGTVQQLQPVNNQTGATYTLEATDYAKLIVYNSPTAVTLTLPQQSNAPTTDGFWCEVLNIGAGAINYVKQGAETLDGNALQNQYSRVKIGRPTTTKWSVAYSTAIIIEQETVCILGTLTNDKVYDVFSAPDDNITIIGFSLRNTSAGTAGTYTAKINGTTVTGLSAIPNTTNRTNTAPTALNTMTYQQVLQYVPTGTTSVVDAFITVFYTRNY